MNIEQRLLRAFDQVERLEPSSDLWTRVVHSIDEDRAHRRRVIRSFTIAVATALVLVAIGWASVRDGVFGQHVDRRVMELLELVGLIVVVVVLGPALRRFGRNYTLDLFPRQHDLATRLLELLDVAYYLVFAGYILLTTQFEFDLGVAGRPASRDLAQQLHEAAVRLGGLLLTMGLLHALTLFVLPLVALVHNSTRQGRALPRWLRNAAVVLAVLAALQFIPFVIGLLVAGLS
jgi:ABC-type spermidine/putrescine transport system permease subunit II